MKKVLYLALCLTFCVWYSCKDEIRLVYSNESSEKPAQVTVIKNTPRQGGAVIKYIIPKDKNLLGVKAVYERNGEICETKASLYTDSLTMEGFGDTQTYDVSLYSVGRNGNLSDPIEIQITPLTPPIHSTTIDLEAAFGGVRVVFAENETRAALAIVLVADTANSGIWEPLYTFYTTADKGIFSLRGLESKEQRFAVYVRDKWENKSDTLVRILTPYEEIKLEKTGWKTEKLPTDTYEGVEPVSYYTLENLWKGPEAPGANAAGYNYASPSLSPMPQHFTIALGYEAAISRMKLWPRNTTEMYSGGFPREFELWGSDNPPLDGSWDNWYLLGKWEVFKPSGYGDGRDVGPVSEADKTHFWNTQDYELTVTGEIPNPYRPVSFVRFKTLSTYSTYGTGATTGQIVLTEIALWGKLTE